LDLDGENRERTRLRLFQFSLRDQASNWLERLPAGSITTWEDLTTRFLAQFFPPGRTAKLRNDIRMFQQHHEEYLSEAWNHFKDLLQKVPHHGIDLWLQDLALYDNESWNDPRDFAKPVNVIALPQDVPSTSDRRLIEIENQVQCLMEAHLAPIQPTQVKKITTPCEICSGPHDTQYCMENPKQAFVDYASSRTDEAGVFRCSRSYPIMDPQCSTQIHSSVNAITIHPKQQSDSHDRTKENEEEERGSPENHPDSPTPPDLSISFITEKVLKFNSLFESLGLVPPSPNAELVCTKEDDGDVMFIEIILKDNNSHKEEPEAGVQEVGYFDIFLNRKELVYHNYPWF
ncbi:MAK10-like protein, partial [Tanacetum coccineum]